MKREMEAIGKAQKLVEEYVYRSLDEMIARRKLKQLYDDCEIEIFLSTFELSDLMQIKLKLEQRLEQLSKEEKGMIIKTEGKPGEGMSYKQMFVGQLRIGGSRRFFMIGEEYWLSEHVANFSLALLHLRKRSLTPAQAQRVLDAVLK